MEVFFSSMIFQKRIEVMSHVLLSFAFYYINTMCFHVNLIIFTFMRLELASNSNYSYHA
jgi:hypothetical protein